MGAEAKNASLSDPARFIADFKRRMGTDTVLAKGHDGKDYRAVDVAATLLGESRKDFEAKMGEPPRECVITIPANYNEVQRSQTLEAARIAGLNVLLTPHEPVAAAMGNAVHKRGDGLVLVIDLGGGTLDVSLLEVSGNNVNTIATAGEQELGGRDFDERIEDLYLDRFAKQHGFRPTLTKHALFFEDLSARAESAKFMLTQRDDTSLIVSCDGKAFSTTITRLEFEDATHDLMDLAMERVEQTLKDVRVSPDKITEFLAVGGASLMRMVAAALAKRFGRKPSPQVDAIYAAAHGGLILGRLEQERQGRPLQVAGRSLPPVGIRLRDVTTHDIGACVLTDDGRELNSVILPRGTPIPSDKTVPFKLADRSQTTALIEVLQGPDAAPRDRCLLIGHFALKDLTPVRDGIHQVDVRLRIDANGMLHASAYDPLSGKSAELEIDYKESAAPSPSR